VAAQLAASQEELSSISDLFIYVKGSDRRLISGTMPEFRLRD
jgi:hypothetical protein